MGNQSRTQNIKVLLPLLLLLSCFMGCHRIEYHGITYAIFFLCFAIYSVFKRNHTPFHFTSFYDKSIIAFILVIYLSFIPAGIWGGQSVYYSFRGSLTYLYAPIFLYIYLNKKAFTEEYIKHCLIFLFLLYLIVYYYSYQIYPKIEFGFVPDDTERIERDYENRGVLRLMIPFEDLIALGLFYFINNPLKKKTINIILIMILAVLTFLRGTRSVMLVTGIIASLLFFKMLMKRDLKNKGLLIIIEFLIIITILYLIFTKTGLASILGLYEDISTTDFESGTDYIRWAMLGYCFSMYNTSIGEYVFGHGIPVQGSFQQAIFKMADYGFFPEDVGYAEIFMNFGILGLLILVCILISVIMKKVCLQHYYAKYYIYYLFLVSFFGRYILTSMILFVTMLYIIKISAWKKSISESNGNGV